MAPKTKSAAKKGANKSRPVFKPQEYHLSDPESDAELQVANKQKEPAWEGFDEDEDSDDDDDSIDIVMENEKPTLPKDDSEEELERLVFGDSAGFRESVKAFALDDSAGGFGTDTDEENAEDDGLAGVADQDLFFFDSGPGIAPPKALAATDDEDDDQDKPAWEDSDDERLNVSLLARSQIKKLREDVADDVISGKEYIRRLRKQYQALYPTPDWALHATGKSKRKRRATGEDGASEDESASDMDVEEDELSAEPLARLLKDADILSRNSRGPAKRRKLQSGTVDIQRLKDVSQKGPSAITSLSFHPTYPLLLSSGPSATLYLHHVKPNPPDPNPLLTSLHIQRTPLTTTAFHPSSSDSRIFLSARRRYFHVWNLATGTIEKISRVYGQQHEQRTMESFSLSPDGKYMALRGSAKKGGGVINILDSNTLQWITQARIESRGGIADFVWWSDGSGMCIVGKNGEVTEYSIEGGVVGRWLDEGAVGTTVIAVGGKSGRNWIGGDRWVAIGSSSGIVNIYDRRAWTENHTSTTVDDPNGGIPKAPKVVRALDNLTTPISHLHFSPDGQMLAMASRWKHNAMRLVHLPSVTVYKNWPTEKTPLGRISAVAWGRPAEEDEKEGSLALLAVGSETGRVRLWEVRA